MVTAAKPAVGGAIYTAPKGSTLPTSATTSLDGAFASLDYISDKGVVRAVELDTSVIKAWGGDVVLVLENGKTETFAFSMLNAHSVAALKVLNGPNNVTGTDLATGISVTSNNKERPGQAYVIDMIERGNTLHRIVIPEGIVTEVEDINYVDSDAVAYGVTITAVADSSGNTCYEYFKTASVT